MHRVLNTYNANNNFNAKNRNYIPVPNDIVQVSGEVF